MFIQYRFLIVLLILFFNVPVQAQSYWTVWFDRDNPSGTGDFEGLHHFGDVCSGKDVIDVQARRISDHLPAELTGQVFVNYNVTNGFSCRNNEQANGQMCFDYEVRFKCGISSTPICAPDTDNDIMHWVDHCSSGLDKMDTRATLKVTMGKNCDEQSIEAIFSGPTIVYRGNPVDAIQGHPIFQDIGISDGHHDVIETEMVSLQLKGGRVTIRAGDNQGNLLDDGPIPPSLRSLYSPGFIHEQQPPDGPEWADSLFHIFLEVDVNGMILHNKDAFIVQAEINKLPPFQIEYRHELSKPIALYNEKDEQVACLESATHKPVSPICLYGVHDGGLNNTQLFTINLETLAVTPIPPEHPGTDIEGLDIHPQTNMLYASSGDDSAQPGHLYQDVSLTLVGNIVDKETRYDYKEVDGLSFNPTTEELWGWSQNDGLIKIDTGSAKATLIIPYPGEIEDLTWNASGTILYAVENLHTAHDVDSHGALDSEEGIRLLSYSRGDTVNVVCPNLMDQLQKRSRLEEIEALEMITDDSLLIGYHGNNTLLTAAVVNPLTCQISAEKEIETDFNDIEGIAWSFISQCLPPN